jgi:magnesium transporter
MNVTVPANGLDPEYPYNMFGVVLGISLLVIICYLYVVRRWWTRAGKRRTVL